MSKPIVVGLSGKARHGKGSVVQLAQILMQKGDDELEVRAVSFATALKKIATDVIYDLERGHEGYAFRHLIYLNLPVEIARQVIDLARGLTIEDLKTKTPQARRLLQFIGTEAFRKNVDDLYWVQRTASAVAELPPETQVVFIPDCRFPNEADYVRRMGGEVWRIERYVVRHDRVDSDVIVPFDNGLSPKEKAHPSETALDGYKFDAVIKATNMDDLFHAVESELRRLRLLA